ncbi:MAG: phosphate regulon transcriptional regulator PhoB [Proteobacteria bacterium]|nr:phosphate regulon transcriptional regulator PhoB [Pseudomonadota bacterium]
MTIQTVMLVEDEPEIREMLSFALTRAGFTTVGAASAEEALQLLDGPLPGVLIIDWMLPGASGIELARRLRRDELFAELPLIMLTARGEEADKLKGFESGIDDYITKPFSPKELIARIRALQRRSGGTVDGRLTIGDLTVDLKSHRLTIGDTPIHLGPTEFRLLTFLMQHPDRAFDRAQLLDRVWGRSVYVEERTVDVHVLRLRRALKPCQLDGLIETVRGVGYRLSPAANDSRA